MAAQNTLDVLVVVRIHVGELTQRIATIDDRKRT